MVPLSWQPIERQAGSFERPPPKSQLPHSHSFAESWHECIPSWEKYETSQEIAGTNYLNLPKCAEMEFSKGCPQHTPPPPLRIHHPPSSVPMLIGWSFSICCPSSPSTRPCVRTASTMCRCVMGWQSSFCVWAGRECGRRGEARMVRHVCIFWMIFGYIYIYNVYTHSKFIHGQATIR